MEIDVFKALTEAAQKAKVVILQQSPDTVFINKNEERFCLYKNTWPLNSAGSSNLALDKAETHACLLRHSVASVEQTCVKYADELPFEKARDFSNTVGEKVVLKPNFGTEGKNLVFCNTWKDTQKALAVFLARFGSANCSRLINIANEYRCIVLDDKVELIYLKQRPYVIGDGKSPLISLLASSQYRLIKLKSEIQKELNSIPYLNQVVVLSNQDNLLWGAIPHNLKKDDGLFSSLKTMAVVAAHALGLRFCAVDIVMDKEGKLLVMEINSGIVFDAFINFSAQNKKEVVRIFMRAIEKLR